LSWPSEVAVAVLPWRSRTAASTAASSRLEALLLADHAGEVDREAVGVVEVGGDGGGKVLSRRRGEVGEGGLEALEAAAEGAAEALLLDAHDLVDGAGALGEQRVGLAELLDDLAADLVEERASRGRRWCRSGSRGA
jgi:hypothetical protein